MEVYEYSESVNRVAKDIVEVSIRATVDEDGYTLNQTIKFRGSKGGPLKPYSVSDPKNSVGHVINTIDMIQVAVHWLRENKGLDVEYGDLAKHI